MCYRIVDMSNWLTFGQVRFELTKTSGINQ